MQLIVWNTPFVFNKRHTDLEWDKSQRQNCNFCVNYHFDWKVLMFGMHDIVLFLPTTWTSIKLCYIFTENIKSTMHYQEQVSLFFDSNYCSCVHVDAFLHNRKLFLYNNISMLHFGAVCQVDHSFPMLATLNISKWFNNQLLLSFKCLPRSIAFAEVMFGAVGVEDIYYCYLNVYRTLIRGVEAESPVLVKYLGTRVWQWWKCQFVEWHVHY